MAEIPFKGPANLFFRNTRALVIENASGKSSAFDLSGRELDPVAGKAAGKALTEALTRTLRLRLEEGKLLCFDLYGNPLFSFGGLGKDAHSFDSPNAIAATDSVLAVSDPGNNRVLLYRLTGNNAVASAPAAGAAGVRVSVMNLHFLPSPFKSRKEKGYVRYSLNTPADVTIIVYDRLGRRVNGFSFTAGQPGGKTGVNEIAWDGKNGAGAYAASGVYVISVRAGAGSAGAEAEVRMSVIAAQ